jgi:hypothetical protein
MKAAMVFYLVPGRNGELELGSRRLNWGIYDKVTYEDLRRPLTDRRGTVHHGSLPPGAARKRRWSRINDLARTYFRVSWRRLFVLQIGLCSATTRHMYWPTIAAESVSSVMLPLAPAAHGCGSVLITDALLVESLMRSRQWKLLFRCG